MQLRHDADVDLVDFYDVPPKVIRLAGGPQDGRAVAIGDCDWPAAWLVPLPPRNMFELRDELYPSAAVDVAMYEWTDSLNDQGERTYLHPGSGVA
jgi:hypothetical protein